MGGSSRSSSDQTSSGVNSSQGVNSATGLNFGLNQSGSSGFNRGSSNNFGFNQGSSSNSGQSSSASSQDVWGTQTPYLQDVYGQAQDAFNQGLAGVQGMTPEVQEQMKQTFQQAAGGYGSQMGGGFAAGLQGQVGPNSYTDAMKGQIAADAQELKQQNLGALDARAAAAGMSGSSGYRNQVGNMMDDVDQNALNAMTNVGYQSYNQGVQNQMNLAGMMDRNQQGAMANLGNLQQGAMAQFNPQMMQQQLAGNYAQQVGGPTTLTQSSSSSRNSGSSNNFGMNTGQSNNIGMNNSFSNGMNAGINMSNGFNNAYGSNVSNGSSSSNAWQFDPSGTMKTAAQLYTGAPVA